MNIDKAVSALRWTCEHNSILRHLDGTKEVFECFANDCKKRNYKCDGSCNKVRLFKNILKESKQ